MFDIWTNELFKLQIRILILLKKLTLWNWLNSALFRFILLLHFLVIQSGLLACIIRRRKSSFSINIAKTTADNIQFKYTHKTKKKTSNLK